MFFGRTTLMALAAIVLIALVISAIVIVAVAATRERD